MAGTSYNATCTRNTKKKVSRDDGQKWFRYIRDMSRVNIIWRPFTMIKKEMIYAELYIISSGIGGIPWNHKKCIWFWKYFYLLVLGVQKTLPLLSLLDIIQNIIWTRKTTESIEYLDTIRFRLLMPRFAVGIASLMSYVLVFCTKIPSWWLVEIRVINIACRNK